MATFVYRRAASGGAVELAGAIGGRRARGRVPMNERVNRGDFVICWGESLPAIAGVKILNGTSIQNKYADAIRLKEAGVPTIEVAATPPHQQAALAVDPAIAIFNEMAEAAADFSELTGVNRTPVFRDGLAQLITGLQRLHFTIGQPIPVATPVATWLPRLYDHVGGEDLLQPPAAPDFFVKKLELVREFRIHSFLGKSIRAGMKAPRENYADGTPGAAQRHPWIRSHEAGWRILYDGVSSKQKHRDLAHKAVAALGLDFGAVDIGEMANGSLVVLEVNRAPGIEGGTVEAYSNAIRQWMDKVA